MNRQKHIEKGCAKYNYGKEGNAVGITPEQWPHFQAIAGDRTDDIDGCVGIGSKIACDLIKAHGTVQGIIDAAKSGRIALTAKKLQVTQ